MEGIKEVGGMEGDSAAKEIEGEREVRDGGR